MALGYLPADQGGTWAILGQKCCTSISAGFEVQQSGITLIERAVEECQKEKNLGGIGFMTAKLEASTKCICGSHCNHCTVCTWCNTIPCYSCCNTVLENGILRLV